jgi:hypothetical protein
MAACAVLFMAGSVQAAVPARGPVQDAINNLLDTMHWIKWEDLVVAGVKLDMSPEQARSALIAKGFTPKAEDPTQDSWSAKVNEGLVARGKGTGDKSKVPLFTMASGSQGERIEVWYAATASGARVSSVKYQIPSNRMDNARFLASADARYGRATYQSAKTRVYCTKGSDSRSSCSASGMVMGRPGLIVDAAFSLNTLRLEEGDAPREVRKQRMAAEIEAKAPRNAAASF